MIDNPFKHRHKWQDRGYNRWGVPTYRICLKCRIRQQVTSGPWEPRKWEVCDPIPELDNVYNEKDELTI